MFPKNLLAIATLSILSLSLTGCEVIETIFKAGVWVGILGILGLVVIAALLLRMVRR